MKPAHIVLTDHGIGCIEAPDDKNRFSDNYHYRSYYEQAIEAAMKEIVLFSDQNVWCWAIPDEMPVKGKLYPVPDGYDVRLTCSIDACEDCRYSNHCYRRVAILVPKQKDIEPEFSNSLEKNFDRLVGGLPKQVPHKCKYCGIMTIAPDEECYARPTSIEEAAKEYSEKIKDELLEQEDAYDHFIEGVRSQAAKDYWLKIFEASHNAQFKQEKK